MRFNVVVYRAEDEDLYVAQCVELDVASQGATVDEALKNVEEAIELYFDEDGVPLPSPAAAVELRQVDVPLAS